MTALDRLRADRKWVAWKYHRRGRGGKQTKPPINPHTGRVASITDSATWGSYEEAIARADAEGLPGVGYVLTQDDNITGADLDHVRNAETGELQPWVMELVAYAETYIEISPSGTGLRIFWEGKIAQAVKNDKQNVEIYGDNRYLTFTNNKLPEAPDAINAAPRTMQLLLARAAVQEESGGGEVKEEDPWDQLNTAALQNLAAWVPALFGEKAKPAARGYRVPSKSLGRDLEEDLSITVLGIVDFGVADQGDERRGRRTPLNLIMEHKSVLFDDAVTWLCQQLGVQRPGVVLDPSDPIVSARTLMSHRYITDEGPILHRHRSTFWIWKDNCYQSINDETLRASIWRFLEGVRRRTNKGVRPFKPKRDNVTNVLDALNAVCQLDPFIAPPTWLRGRDMPPAIEFLACANGLLHIPTRTLYPGTPDFFGHYASTVVYDPDAPKPDKWLKYLNETLMDAESIQLAQEWAGYTLTPDTSQQKIALAVGPKRGGKGTYGRLLTMMLGASSVAGPTMASLGENFGLEPLITKPLAIISDARLGGRTDKSIIVERLLTVSGEDALSVPRKFMPDWIGRLPTRFMIMTNEFPSLTEGSGALAGRFMVLVFKQSFFGREDIGLTHKLSFELPGILNWALEGYDQLRQRGHFHQPAVAYDTLESIEMLCAPIKAFLRDRCLVGPAHEILIDDLYDGWKAWGITEGRKDPGTKEWFGRNLHSAIPGLSVVRKGLNGSQGRWYVGVSIAGHPADQPANGGRDIPF